MSLSPQANALLSDRNLQIGNICFQWAHLEYLLSITIGILLRVEPKTSQIISSGLDILPRTNMALALAHHLTAPRSLVDGLKAVRRDLQDGKKLLERRNRAVHGHRQLHPSPDREIFNVYRGKGAGAIEQTNADLHRIGNDIAETATEFYQVMVDAGMFVASCEKPARIIAQNASRNTGPSESTDES